MLRTQHVILMFLPAVLLAFFALMIQLVRYAPLRPEAKNDQQTFHIPIFSEDPILGDKRAAATIIAFGDLGCGPCQEQLAMLESLASQYPKKIKVIWKGLSVIRIPDSSVYAHDVAFCAEEQNKFPEFEKTLREKQDLSEKIVRESAEDAGLNDAKLTECLSSARPGTYRAKVESLARALNIQTVPTFFIEQTQIQAPTSLDGWKTILQL